MYPNGLQLVGNGVSLLPCKKITGTCSTRPWLPPNPITGQRPSARRISRASGKEELQVDRVDAVRSERPGPGASFPGFTIRMRSGSDLREHDVTVEIARRNAHGRARELQRPRLIAQRAEQHRSQALTLRRSPERLQTPDDLEETDPVGGLRCRQQRNSQRLPTEWCAGIQRNGAFGV